VGIIQFSQVHRRKLRGFVDQMQIDLEAGSFWNRCLILILAQVVNGFSTVCGLVAGLFPQIQLFTGQHQNQFRYISI
jgi:hypothetical protein